jgi:hypothetical protein
LVTLPRSRWYGLPPGSSAGRDSTLEQAALRHIATLVAGGVQPHELFAAVAEEVGRVVGASSVGIVRYECDDTATVCGGFPPTEPLFRTGSRIALEGASVLGLIRTRAKPARVDNYAGLEGEIADAARRRGLRSSVASRSWLPGTSGGRSSLQTPSASPRAPEPASPSSRICSWRRL